MKTLELLSTELDAVDFFDQTTLLGPLYSDRLDGDDTITIRLEIDNPEGFTMVEYTDVSMDSADQIPSSISHYESRLGMKSIDAPSWVIKLTLEEVLDCIEFPLELKA